MELAEIDKLLDALCEEAGVDPAFKKADAIGLQEADRALDALALDAQLAVPLPALPRLPTDPPVDEGADSESEDMLYESFAPPVFEASDSRPGASSDGASFNEVDYDRVPAAPPVPQLDSIPHRPPSSIPPVRSSTFPSEVPSEAPPRSSVSRSFSPPKFSDSSVPPPTSAPVDRPPEFAGIPSSARPGREDTTDVLSIEDDDLQEMDLDELEGEITQRESIAPSMMESDIGSLVPQGIELSLSSRPPPLEAAAAGSQPPDETDWSDEFEDAFDILVDPDDPKN